MARHEATVKLIWEDPDSWQVIQIQEADTTYAVYYRGEPFQLRTYNQSSGGFMGYKYARTTFSGNAAHAFNLADKLNERFDCDEFYVVRLGVERVLDLPEHIKRGREQYQKIKKRHTTPI